MSAKVTCVGLKGLDGYRVQVEAEVTEGVESMVVVGLPDASVKESKERVSAAVRNLGFPLVDKKWWSIYRLRNKRRMDLCLILQLPSVCLKVEAF